MQQEAPQTYQIAPLEDERWVSYILTPLDFIQAKYKN